MSPKFRGNTATSYTLKYMYRFKIKSASITNLLEIDIGKIWSILSNSSNTKTLQTFPDQIVLYLYFFTSQKQFLSHESIYTCQVQRKNANCERNKEGFIAKKNWALCKGIHVRDFFAPFSLKKIFDISEDYLHQI